MHSLKMFVFLTIRQNKRCESPHDLITDQTDHRQKGCILYTLACILIAETQHLVFYPFEGGTDFVCVCFYLAVSSYHFS